MVLSKRIVWEKTRRFKFVGGIQTTFRNRAKYRAMTREIFERLMP
jgi:hypothetical protein